MSIHYSSPSTDITTIRKRDGSEVPFNGSRICRAIWLAMQSQGEGSEKEAVYATDRVINALAAKVNPQQLLNIDEIQDIVISELGKIGGLEKTTKHYTIWRHEHDKTRDASKYVTRQIGSDLNTFHSNPVGFWMLRKYARNVAGADRRETWIEVCDRYVNYMRKRLNELANSYESNANGNIDKRAVAINTIYNDNTFKEIRNAIINMEVMPAMRIMQLAGEAIDRTDACAYNCAYTVLEKLDDIADSAYILMCGAGVTYSVEYNTEALPIIAKWSGEFIDDPKQITHSPHIIGDSREGWCDAIKAGLHAWYAGLDIKFDYSKIRPAGSILKTMGGTASGDRPLREFLEFTKQKIRSRERRRLTPLMLHDIMCKLVAIVEMGNMRRAAGASLSCLDDIEMRDCKIGQFWHDNPQRSATNNSAVYEHPPTFQELASEMLALDRNGTGERGIFYRPGILGQMPKRRLDYFIKEGVVRLDTNGNPEFTGTDYIGSNPCFEIFLRNKCFCNLTEIICRETDTVESLLRKARIATLIGTYQATLTNFKYIDPKWKHNCEAERLLGVSLTGMRDSPVVCEPITMRTLRDEIIKINADIANAIGINQATATTCVKPSGSVSKLVNASAGIAPRYAKYYIQRFRSSPSNPLFRMLRDQGAPCVPEYGQTPANATVWVIEFPVQSPENTITKNDLNAMDQLEFWRSVKTNYCEHNPSTTILIRDCEWTTVLNWVYHNINIIGGLAFYPFDNKTFELQPLEECDEDKYIALKTIYDGIDFSKIVAYERGSTYQPERELACSGLTCEYN